MEAPLITPKTRHRPFLALVIIAGCVLVLYLMLSSMRAVGGRETWLGVLFALGGVQHLVGIQIAVHERSLWKGLFSTIAVLTAAAYFIVGLTPFVLQFAIAYQVVAVVTSWASRLERFRLKRGRKEDQLLHNPDSH